MKISVREIRNNELHFIIDYFSNADTNYLLAMGADKRKMLGRKEWMLKLATDYDKPVNEKEFYYLLWLVDGEPVGHSNINKITFGNSAYMHLHMWEGTKRQKGLGSQFVERCILVYFKTFQLKKLICEPYANNPAPNKVVKKLGFKFIKTYETIPGGICFMQFVNKYELSRESFNSQNL